MNSQIDSVGNEPIVLPAEKPVRRRSNCAIVVGVILLIGVALLAALYFTVGKPMLAAIHENAGTACYEHGDLDCAISEFSNYLKTL